jgi:hypothetical protein
MWLRFKQNNQERRDDRCAAITKTNMSMSISTMRRLIAMMVMSTATRLRLIAMSTSTTMGITSTGTPAATNGKPRFCETIKPRRPIPV